MTYGDVMVQVLCEVTGQPRATFARVVDMARMIDPHTRIDDEITDQEAQRMIAKLRNERAGILNWIAKGAMR